MAVREPAEPAKPGDPRTGERHDRSPWNWLLLLPLVAVLFPPMYNSVDPGLSDIPFFYWYQLSAIALSVVVTLVVYQKTRR
jgi:hypothetical protein